MSTMKSIYSKQFEGKLWLELRNGRTGKLENVVETQNFAANQTNEYGKWLQRNAFKTGLSTLGVTDIDYSPHQAANAIVLTDYTGTEDPSNEWYMSGKTIGYAIKATYAGTDIWRGTVATTQLQATSALTKWTFDWPTHAGNGTIGSVGWVDSQSQTLSATEPVFRSTMTALSSHTSAGNWTSFARASNTTAFGNTGTTVVYVLDGLSYAQTTTFNVNAQFTAVRGLAWDSTNNFLWVIGDNSSARRIAAYNSSGVLQTGPFTITTRSYIRLVHDGTSLWSITQDSGSNHSAWKINTTDGTDMTNFQFVTNTSSVVCGLAWNNNLLWARYSGTTGFQAWDTSGNRKVVEISTSVYTPSAANYSTNLSSAYDFDFINSSHIAVAQATNMIYRCRLDGMGTRALLPSPVTKNNTQTLKLIYQINYT